MCNCKFWALGGLTQKSKNVLKSATWRDDGQKNGSIPSRNKKRKIDLKEQHDKQTDAKTDRVNDKK